MDNASKALLMAGGMLIAIAIISVAVYAYSNARGFASNSEAMLSASQIQSFNRFYTAYGDGSPVEIKCIDGINILNRAVEDDIKVIQKSGKISVILRSVTDPISNKSTYIVADGDSKKYVEKVKFSFTRDLDGKINSVKIED